MLKACVDALIVQGGIDRIQSTNFVRAIWEVVPIRLVTSHDLGGRFPPRKVRCVAFDLNMPNPFCATLAQTELNSCRLSNYGIYIEDFLRLTDLLNDFHQSTISF